MANRVEEAVEKIAEEILANTDYELVDVEYVKERDWFLRVYIDKEGGIGLDDCQEVSGLLDEKLEELNIINDRYILEVSSPGLDRLLFFVFDLMLLDLYFFNVLYIFVVSSPVLDL